MSIFDSIRHAADFLEEKFKNLPSIEQLKDMSTEAFNSTMEKAKSTLSPEELAAWQKTITDNLPQVEIKWNNSETEKGVYGANDPKDLDTK